MNNARGKLFDPSLRLSMTRLALPPRCGEWCGAPSGVRRQEMPSTASISLVDAMGHLCSMTRTWSENMLAHLHLDLHLVQVVDARR